MMRDDDEILKKIADGYAERYGWELRAEHEWLSRQEQAPEAAVSEIGVTRRVTRKIAAEKRKPLMRVLPLIAACIVIAVIFLPNLPGSDVAAPSPHVPPLHAPTASTLPLPSASAPSSAPEAYAVIPLSAPLPRGFTQTGFDQDREKSIYYIEDVNLDNVVLTLEPAGAPTDTADLVEIILGGSVVFGKQTDAYCLLTFSSDDVLYTLTSRHDINTLLRLGYAFV